jgi:hypothetical protein
MTRPLMVTGNLACLGLLLAACNRQDATPAAAGSTAAPALAVAGSAVAAPAPGGLDPCLIGNWKTTKVTLKVDQMSAEGGDGMTMQVAPTGVTVIDFTRMSDIRAKSPAVNFDFKYSGKATGTLTTPSAGKIESKQADYAGLRVTANVKLPGAGSMPMFKDTPISDLVKMAEGMAAKTGAPGAGKPPQGIDATPVFSSNSYTCSPELLTLQGDQLDVVWLFARDKG